MDRLFSVVAFALVLGASATAARAQGTAPPVESMPLRIGPLGLAPSVAITDIGVDDNVFNDADNPQRDFTATITPRLEARLRMRRVVLGYISNADLVYFQKFKSERSANSSTDLQFEADLGHLQPYASATWLATKQRLSSELDWRAPRTQRTFVAGTRLLVASRTALLFNARRQENDFEDGVTFRGVELARTLDSTVESAEAGIRMTLTPLTTFTLAASVQRDRFSRSPERDADTVRILPSLQFDPSSLLRGSLAIGYRRFTPRSEALPPYSGLVVQGTLGYTLLGRTRFDVDVQRDVQYSYEDLEPYYLTQGGRLTLTHQLVGMLDVQAVGGRQTLSYRTAGEAGESRQDRVETLGAGLGYRIRERTRLAVNWEATRRQSDLDDRQYKKRRVYASLTFGM